MEHTSYLESIRKHFVQRQEGDAFFINETWYSYGQLAGLTAAIQDLIHARQGQASHVGVFLSNDLHTYASILALWMSGKAFIPLNPLFPGARNRQIMEQLGLELILCSIDPDPEVLIPGCTPLGTGQLELDSGKVPVIREIDAEKDSYVLFTSGSTGEPKGVRISFQNLHAFLHDFMNYPGYSFGTEDRFLQIYDLSFDGSIPSWVAALAAGASVFTVPPGEIKYLAAFKLMKDHQLTFIKMPPSTLTFLRPYFPSIELPEVKYCLLGGEALPANLLKEFEPCIPNALIQNVYGPTEATVISAIYDWNSVGSRKKELQGIASLGRPLGTCQVLVVDRDDEVAGPGSPGELLIAGDQVSPGYWNNADLNRRLFVEREVQGEACRFYRTGDLVIMDSEGDLMFMGRNDDQVQVMGYRVELGEIEALARSFLDGTNVVALGTVSEAGQAGLSLALESAPMDLAPLRKHLEAHLPPYMIPGAINCITTFPRLVSGKLDRRAIREQSREQIQE